MNNPAQGNMFKVFDLFFSFTQFFAGRNITEEMDRKELGTVLKSLVSLQFVVEDDRKPLVPSDENEDQGSATSDREGQTQELRSQQGEAHYGSKRISFFLF